MDNQDWKPVLLKKNQSVLNKEEKKRNTITVVSTKNPNANNNDINLKKLDGDMVVPIMLIPKEISKEIQYARSIQKLTQQDLANKLCIKKNIINDLESGKMPYNKAFVNKVKRILKI